MKKYALLFSSFLVLAACDTTTVENDVESLEESVASVSVVDEVAEITVTINLSIPDEEIEETHEFQTEDGAILLDVMQANFDIVDDNGFFTSIDGYEQNEADSKYWLFDINGEMAEVGAGELELTEGDVVDWSLAGFE